MSQLSQADFLYGAAAGRAAMGSLSIFADRAHLREQLREDAATAGFHVRQAAPLAHLLDTPEAPLGEAAIVDCPAIDAGVLATLTRLDGQAARTGAHLVISTGLDSLDLVFAGCGMSNPEILVDPSHADRILALGRLAMTSSGGRVKEMSDPDRLALLRLTEQVGQIAATLEAFGAAPGTNGRAGTWSLSGAAAGGESAGGDSATGIESTAGPFAGYSDPGPERLVRSTRPPLPDPRLVRLIVRHRQLRSRFFQGDLFADPAWDILLDLTAARAEHIRVSVSSLCIASGVPPTTALRWISQMTGAGLLERVEDEADRRRAFIGLTDKTADAMAGYFAEVGRGAAQLV